MSGALALLVGAVGLAAPASASLTGPGVGAGRNITVFHNIDMVGAFGFGAAGDVITVEVWRGDVRIGTATGPLVDAGAGPALEVNHGPLGTPAPGDCWEGTTPDIRPGDRLVVRHAAGVDEITVDDIGFTFGPFEDTNGDVVLQGIAKRFDGTPIAPALLDSGEFRDTTGKYRTGPNVVEATPGVAGGFTVRYQAPYLTADGRNRNNLSEAQRKAALLANGAGHAIGFGHTPVLPAESQLVEGVADASGPALGCEGSPAGPLPPPPPPPAEDTVAPTVTDRAPADGAQSVLRGANVTATFSEAVTGVDGTTFTLRNATTNAAVNAVVSYSSGVATLNPAVNLAASTRYTATLTQGIKDTAGTPNPLAGTSWSFTTAAATNVAPTVTGRTPAANATGVARGVNVSARFSEAVTGLSTTTFALRLASATSTSTPLAAAVTNVAGTNRWILNPGARLLANRRYRVTLTGGTTAIRDLAGAPLAGSPVSWTFTTGAGG